MVLPIHGLHSSIGIRYRLANVVDAAVFQSGPSLLTAHHLFIREKKEASGGELSQLPTAKLTNSLATTYILFFFLQSQCSKYPSSYSRLVALVVPDGLPLLTLQGAALSLHPFLLLSSPFTSLLFFTLSTCE